MNNLHSPFLDFCHEGTYLQAGPDWTTYGILQMAMMVLLTVVMTD